MARMLSMIIGRASIVALAGCNKPASGSFVQQGSDTSSDPSIPADYKLANPCPPGVPSVYLRPDGSYVVKNSEDHDNFIVIAQTPEDFCKSFQKN